MRRQTLTKTLAVVAALVLLSAPVVLAEHCQCDFDCDGNVYPGDLSVFLGEYGKTDCTSCPAPVPAGVPQTGQTYCYIWGHQKKD